MYKRTICLGKESKNYHLCNCIKCKKKKIKKGDVFKSLKPTDSAVIYNIVVDVPVDEKDNVYAFGFDVHLPKGSVTSPSTGVFRIEKTDLVSNFEPVGNIHALLDMCLSSDYVRSW